MSARYDIGSLYEGSMTWDSSEGTVGMTVLDARGDGFDGYTQRSIDELTERDNNVASGVIALVNNKAA